MKTNVKAKAKKERRKNIDTLREAIRQLAREDFSDDDLLIEEEADVFLALDGAWVAASVWVPDYRLKEALR